MSATPRDQDLMSRLQTDSEAFEMLYRRHVRRLTSYAATRCRSAEDVADLVATTFVAALESVGRYDPTRGEPLPWLIGIARHLSADLARNTLREREALRQVAGQRSLSRDELADLEEHLDAARRASELHNALGRLHVRDREPLVLIGQVGLTHAQAAQALGVSAATFRVRLMRARVALRRAREQSTGGDGPGRVGPEGVPT